MCQLNRLLPLRSTRRLPSFDLPANSVALRLAYPPPPPRPQSQISAKSPSFQHRTGNRSRSWIFTNDSKFLIRSPPVLLAKTARGLRLVAKRLCVPLSWRKFHWMLHFSYVTSSFFMLAKNSPAVPRNINDPLCLGVAIASRAPITLTPLASSVRKFIKLSVGFSREKEHVRKRCLKIYLYARCVFSRLIRKRAVIRWWLVGSRKKELLGKTLNMRKGRRDHDAGAMQRDSARGPQVTAEKVRGSGNILGIHPRGLVFDSRLAILISVFLSFPKPRWADAEMHFTAVYGVTVAAWLACLPPPQKGEPRSVPGRVTGFSHVEIVPDDAGGRRVFSGIFRFSRPFHSGAAPYSLQSPSSDLQTSLNNRQFSSLLHTHLLLRSSARRLLTMAKAVFQPSQQRCRPGSSGKWLDGLRSDTA
ncbi:hypothetical protein PR048_017076 [Dryococelus australis]|uniref:Uncharacterized protein n=1 Tax=Dryococelus australis TaxID=614101 RepID=A0ABQ9H8H4_9NEOP|nr:hypothetical protein PR048_017076 [Dryococelus australis]